MAVWQVLWQRNGRKIGKVRADDMAMKSLCGAENADWLVPQADLGAYQAEMPEASETDTPPDMPDDPPKPDPEAEEMPAYPVDPGGTAQDDSQSAFGGEPGEDPGMAADSEPEAGDTLSVKEDPAQSRRLRMPRQRRDARIVSIDAERSVETDTDRLRSDLLDLVESMKGRKILTDMVQSVERPSLDSELSYAVIYHGAFKVIIPVQEMVEEPEDCRGQLRGDVLNYLLNKRLGAEVDYIVKGVDQETGVAAASRLEAMAKKRKEYYFRTDQDGNCQIYAGILTMDRGGSTTYTLSCMESSVPVPSPEPEPEVEPQPESPPETGESPSPSAAHVLLVLAVLLLVVVILAALFFAKRRHQSPYDSWEDEEEPL